MNDGAFPAPAARGRPAPRRRAGGRRARGPAARPCGPTTPSTATTPPPWPPPRTGPLVRPGGDQRRGRELRPSRWLLDTLGALAGPGRRLYSGDLATTSAGPRYRVLPSFTGRGARRRRALLVGRPRSAEPARWREADRVTGRPLPGSGSYPVLGAGVRARRQRASGGSPASTGTSSAATGLDLPVGRDPQSADRARDLCRLPPALPLRPGPAGRGHRRPEDVLRDQPPGPGARGPRSPRALRRRPAARPPAERIRPASPWGPTPATGASTVAEAVFAGFEARPGWSGARCCGASTGRAILRDLHRFLDEDDRYRAAGRRVPEAVELAFGAPGHGTGATSELPSGRGVRFGGSRRPGRPGRRRALVVIDYKTGSRHGFGRAGRRPGRRGHQAPAGPLRAGGPAPLRRRGRSRQLLVRERRGRLRAVGYPLDHRRSWPASARCSSVLVDGHRGGRLPGPPGEPERPSRQLPFCDFEAAVPGRPAAGPGSAIRRVRRLARTWRWPRPLAEPLARGRAVSGARSTTGPGGPHPAATWAPPSSSRPGPAPARPRRWWPHRRAGGHRRGPARPDRRHHLHRGRRRRAAGPGRRALERVADGPRRRGAGAGRRVPPGAGGPSGPGRPRPRSTAPPSAPCTASPAGSWPSTRSRPASRRLRRARRGALARWPSMSGGTAFVDRLLERPRRRAAVLRLCAAG